MTLCAGLCCFDGQLCSVRLSAPLLRLRPRSDTINTLLHEMIHGVAEEQSRVARKASTVHLQCVWHIL
jgi:hypothetical protein